MCWINPLGPLYSPCRWSSVTVALRFSMPVEIRRYSSLCSCESRSLTYPAKYSAAQYAWYHCSELWPREVHIFVKLSYEARRNGMQMRCTTRRPAPCVSEPPSCVVPSNHCLPSHPPHNPHFFLTFTFTPTYLRTYTSSAKGKIFCLRTLVNLKRYREDWSASRPEHY